MMRRKWVPAASLMICLFLTACQGQNLKKEEPAVGETEMDESAKSGQPIELSESAKAEQSTSPEPSANPTASVSPEQPADPPVCDDAEFVRVQDYIPGIVVDLKYATTDNFTGTVIYTLTDAYLRYGTVQKLKAAQEQLEAEGLGLKIWDAYRPVTAQERLWEVYPDPVYVANPANGITSHSRGDTVDITMVYADGSDVLMPTGFDDFTVLADRDYTDCDQDAAAHAMMLEEVMYANGFSGYSGEWWDYSDTTQYWDGVQFEP